MSKTDFTRPSFWQKGLDLTGQTLDDYRFERRIGAGAMAEVWLATQLSLDRPVALKILREELARDETYVRRFLLEAQSAAKLEDANIVRIYEVGTFPVSVRSGIVRMRNPQSSLFHSLFRKNDNDRQVLHYISQEYVNGLNLQQYLGCHGPLSVRQTLAIMLKVASALRKAAGLGIVHRDIKPENILIGENGLLKIADFGLARCETPGQSDVSLTQLGMTLGTPLYMSPEQSEGKQLDSRSDIYSLGVTVFQLLTGKPPFSGETPLAVILCHLKEKAPCISDYRSDIPEELGQMIARMLEKKPEDRYSSPDELIDGIRAIAKKTDSGNETCSLPLTGTEKEKTDVPGSIPASFDDDKSFCDTMALTAMSLQLQTQIGKLREIQKKNRFLSRFSFGSGMILTLLLFIAFIAGLGLAMYRHLHSYVQLRPPAQPVIERFNTVEEQYVFASQLGTVDAWKSVADYFPALDYWKRKSRQQLARTYVIENDLNRARPIFWEFAEMSDTDAAYISFGQAGIAWCFATEGNTSQAAAILSELRTGRNASFDRLTEDIITRTQELIRNRKDTG